uniref:Uncharacterized protein n=1 Tax=Anguilla anguilla TaxID=7936 RepID=A0A0E9SQD3_ANGAN
MPQPPTHLPVKITDTFNNIKMQQPYSAVMCMEVNLRKQVFCVG